MITKLIVAEAKKYLGQREVKGNMGFVDKEFEEKMETIGFQKGWSWCALFVELVWRRAYAQFDASYDRILHHLHSAGAVKTFNNFKRSSLFVTTDKPQIGAIVIWQTYKNGKAHWSGHAGIVESVNAQDPVQFIAIEGNGSETGSREGTSVVRKTRRNNIKSKVTRGLKVKGFIVPSNETGEHIAEASDLLY
jgi:hypothetical protein